MHIPKANSRDEVSVLGSSPSTALSVAFTTVLGAIFTFSTAGDLQAGDILRGGAVSGAPARSAPVAGGGVAPTTAKVRANAKDTLARTTQAIQAVKAMQSSARDAAIKGPNNLGMNPVRGRQLPNVPNGLAPGGLQIDPAITATNRALWQGATLPKQTISGGKTNVVIRQTKQQALLNWKTFNVGKNTELYFDQRAGGENSGQWIAFNKINDPTGAPSQILGSIKAEGQVYVINQNGIIFGGSSQINLHTLVASALPINDNLIARGLLNNPDSQFLFSGLSIAAGTNGTPAFTPLATDPVFNVNVGAPAYTISQPLATGSTPVLKYTPAGSSSPTTLVAADYVTSTNPAGKTVVTFTNAGLTKVGANPVTASYSSGVVRYGDVVVQKGAQISAPTSAAHVGGRVALVGANVANAGTISTPDGQTILAAGLQAGFAAHSKDDPTLRGLDVYVGAVKDSGSLIPGYAGSATNSGLIDAQRASVTMVGKSVNQLGAIDSSTSVTLNGRIDLLASYDAVGNPQSEGSDTSSNYVPFLSRTTGTLKMGAGSVMQILPDYSSDERVIGTQLALPSVISMQGKAIHLETDSVIFAPGASLPSDPTKPAIGFDRKSLGAGVTINAGIWRYIGSATNSTSTFLNSGGQIYLEPGATINVAGSSDIQVPVGQNIITAELRGAELSDSPLQRLGFVRGLSVQIDIRKSGIWNGVGWIGTPLGNVAGYAGLIERTVGELTVAGGTVRMNAGESVVMQPGSIVDVSGGWIDFQGGMVQTTRLISEGQIFDISQATPDRIYDGIYDGTFTKQHVKWGVEQTYTNPLLMNGAHFEEGYIQGANGGFIEIRASSMALDGSLLGHTVAGPRQRSVGPDHSSLSLAFQSHDTSITGEAPPLFSPTPPVITFSTLASQQAAGAFTLDATDNPLPLSADRIAHVILSSGLLEENGFGILKIENSDGDVRIPTGVSLNAPVKGSITITGANIDVQGSLIAPSGNIGLTAFNVSQVVFNTPATETQPKVTPAVDPSRGFIKLGSTARLSTAGLIVDDRMGIETRETLPLITHGGTIFLNSFSADLKEGSVMDASGGVALNEKAKQSYGDGGSISILTGVEPRSSEFSGMTGGSLALGSTLSAYSGAKAGSLSIQAPLIQIGGSNNNPGTLHLSPEFFNQGGFASFTLTGLGAATGEEVADGAPKQMVPGLVIASGTVINPQVQSWLTEINQSPGSGIVLAPTLHPVGIRTPASLTFEAKGVDDFYLTGSEKLLVRGDLVLGENALIQTDPKGSVTLKGATVELLGSVIAPGGSISVSGKTSSKFSDLPAKALATVHIGPNAILSAAGTTILTPNAYGYRTGSVVPGGSIKISGNIVAEAGSLLDVSGATDILDFAPSYIQDVENPATAVTANSGINSSLYATTFVPTRVDSNGGSIALTGNEMLFTAATLRGVAGGPSALGGSLSISSDRFYLSGIQRNPADAALVVTQKQLPFSPGSQSGYLGYGVLNADGVTIPAMGYFAANTLKNSGFDSLTLNGLGAVEFSGPVDITMRGRLSVADRGIIIADDVVNLTASYVALGQPFKPPFSPLDSVESKKPFGEVHVHPSYGAGQLNVTADVIDIGNLSLQNIGSARFIADGGDIRGDGTLNVAGDIYMRAGQIYPPTATSFTIAAFDKNILVAASTAGNPTVTLASAILPPGFGIGSPLFGSTVQSINGATVTLEAGASKSVSGEPELEAFAPGSVTIAGSGNRPIPLSAGGELNIYGSIINQGGTLRAPFGRINLGWDGTGEAPENYLSGDTVPITQRVTLSAGSITSVSAVDPLTGLGILIPYGINLNGTSWIDPSGTDITATGAPGKAVNIYGLEVASEKGSTIDIRGGGDLYAYRWVNGQGGTKDILASTGSFAIMPEYLAAYVPYAAFGSGANAANLGGNPGYVNSTLNAGDKIYLGEGSGLPSGNYTLLPARYALMPGAYLVTPKSGAPIGQLAMPDGSTLVQGYRFNGLNPDRRGGQLNSWYEVLSSDVMRSRAEYTDYTANQYFLQRARELDIKAAPLPAASGHLVLQATQAMTLQGKVLAQALNGARGGFVDISSPVDILINGTGSGSGNGQLVLNANELSAFGAESLLIGGVRHTGANGTTVTVRTGNLTLSNAGNPLSAPEIILVANDTLTLSPRSQISQSGRLSGPAETLFIGSVDANGNVLVSGDGTLLRVSSDPYARSIRLGLGSSTDPNMIIGAGAQISGASITLDSTYNTSLAANVNLIGDVFNLASGRISIQLDNPGALQSATGLVLAGSVLDDLEAADSVSLLSYSSIDIYGTGQFRMGGKLALHAATIQGFNNGGGTAAFSAGSIVLDNSADVELPASLAATSGTLELNARSIRLGKNNLLVERFDNVELSASSGLAFGGVGSFSAQNDLIINTPVVTGAKAADHAITAKGDLIIDDAGSGSRKGGVGASLELQGSSIIANANFILPSGALTLHATSGDITVGGRLDVGGITRSFLDLTAYTPGGQIRLVSDLGSVTLGADSVIAVDAQGAGAGSLSISAPTGTLNIAGTMRGQGGLSDGSFSLDIGSLPALSAFNTILDTASFNESRSFRVRSGDVLVDGTATAHTFNVSADQGSISVTGTIDASGVTGGEINLVANGSVVLNPGAVLNVAGENFSNAGKGGHVSLEAGSSRNGVAGAGAVSIQAGSTIDLSVTASTAESAGLGKLTGTLHLRAPQNAGGTSLSVSPINGTILNASSIVVEGYKIYQTASVDGVTGTVQANGNVFGSNAVAIEAVLLANNAGLAPALTVNHGAEIINVAGDLTLASSWNLSNLRFGPDNAPGILTMRAFGNLVFNGALSDGFTSADYNATLLTQNMALPVNAQSWAYRLAAGADLSAADFHQVRSLSSLAANSGSLLLGKDNGNNTGVLSGNDYSTSLSVPPYYQVIRTGTGDIDIATGRDVKLLNHFATIYTAGVQITDPTMGGTFDLPSGTMVGLNTGNLGTAQQAVPYLAQYSFAGGNVVIAAQGDITHQSMNGGSLIADSSRQLPNNWLYRRGFVDSTTGLFGEIRRSGSGIADIGSTTWWVDFSNFFEGVGALGGGDVTMIAGNDISNVDAVIPTNARMPGKNSNGPIAPDAGTLVELGGGDLVVRAGRDIDAGVYYVERGTGRIDAGRSIHTNSTRTPSLGTIINQSPLDQNTWLPTTLFVGKSQFDIFGRSDVLMGPATNLFLMPQGFNNSFWNKTYFSTYDGTGEVNVTSLGGDLTLGLGANAGDGANPMLFNWISKVSLLQNSRADSPAYTQPWIRLAESTVAQFKTLVSLMPSTLRATAFSGDINIKGNLTLAPARNGTLELAASDSINGVQPLGLSIQGLMTWSASQINLSDANPGAVPGVATPIAFRNFAPLPRIGSSNQILDVMYLDSVNALFDESGATLGSKAVLQTKQALHAQGLLHLGDPDPIYLYAQGGDISGLTVFSAKPAQIVAGRDITDIAFYIQNLNEDDSSVVSAGRDIVAYNANSPLRSLAQAAGNPDSSGGQAGDIQINGPGAIEVLAGRHLDLGTGGNNADGTGAGLTSIGNARNPFLPFGGADIIAGAGIGKSAGLGFSNLDFEGFIGKFLNSPEGIAYLAEQANSVVPFEEMSPARQRISALGYFYRVLRDTGRNYTTSGNYDTGFDAINTLFAGTDWEGEVKTQARDIRTRSGGDISIFSPGGGLALATTVIGTPLAPPGIITESGGNISIFTNTNVDIGISRIFTLRGGDEVIWSSIGNIAAGTSSKTVQSAPPTRVLVDPQSADIKTDLAGLATGGGIGVLATTVGVPPGNVDLIAPGGIIDAGDAGIRVTGSINIAAVQVLGASNIAAGGTSTGVPASAPATSASVSSAPPPPPPTQSNSNPATTAAKDAQTQAGQTQDTPSIVTVEVLGYGGGEGESEPVGSAEPQSPVNPSPAVNPALPHVTPDPAEEEEKKRREAAETEQKTA